MSDQTGIIDQGGFACGDIGFGQRRDVEVDFSRRRRPELTFDRSSVTRRSRRCCSRRSPACRSGSDQTRARTRHRNCCRRSARTSHIGSNEGRDHGPDLGVTVEGLGSVVGWFEPPLPILLCEDREDHFAMQERYTDLPGDGGGESVVTTRISPEWMPRFRSPSPLTRTAKRCGRRSSSSSARSGTASM